MSLADVEAATCTWTGRPVRIISLRPDSLDDVWSDMRRIARGLDADAAGEALVADTQARIAAVAVRTAKRPRVRVAFIEWVEPLMSGGNWMPALIEAAGGENLFGHAGARSGFMQWQEVAAADPEAIIVAPCGYDLARSHVELALLEARPEWRGLRAVKNGRVYFADGNAYFNRPGPRLADTAELIAEMLHPDDAGAHGDGTAWLRPAVEP